MENEMVERVAKAIDECPEWPAKTYRERMARAAIKAMRKPIARMNIAGRDDLRAWGFDEADEHDAEYCFVSMIDAAVSQSPQPVEGDDR